MPNRTNCTFHHLSLHKLTSLWRLPEYQLKPHLVKPNPSLFLPFFLFPSLFFIIYFNFWTQVWEGSLSMFLTCCVCLVIFLMQFVRVWKSSCRYTTTPYDHCGVILSLLQFPKVFWCSEMVSTEFSHHFLASEACSEVLTLIQGFPQWTPKIEDQRVLRVRICVVCDSFHPIPSVYPSRCVDGSPLFSVTHLDWQCLVMFFALPHLHQCRSWSFLRKFPLPTLMTLVMLHIAHSTPKQARPLDVLMRILVSLTNFMGGW